MARKSNPNSYSHTSLLKDVIRDESGKITSVSAPYGSADIAMNGEIIAIRKWDKTEAKQKTSPPKAKAFAKR